jgi:hypothetical protein
MIKNIKIHKQTSDKEVKDLDKEGLILTKLLHDTSKKFKTENNMNTIEYCTDVLMNDYVYVPLINTLSIGRYCKYIDMSDPNNFKLKMGGFVISDNNYTVVMKQNHKIFKVIKRSKLWFMKLNDIDKMKLKLLHLVNN